VTLQDKTEFRILSKTQEVGPLKISNLIDLESMIISKELLNIWDALSFKHKAELWAGKHSDKLSIYHRIWLWHNMTFSGRVAANYVDLKEFKNRDLDPNRIGKRELNHIWHKLKRYSVVDKNSMLEESKVQTKVKRIASRRTSTRKYTVKRTASSDTVGADRRLFDPLEPRHLSIIHLQNGLINSMNKNEEGKNNLISDATPSFPNLEDIDMYRNRYIIDSSKRKFTINNMTEDHLIFIEELLYGKDGGNGGLFSEIRHSKLNTKIRILSRNYHTAGDQRLMLWYLTPIKVKRDMILNCRNNVLSDIMTFMFLEEVHDNPFMLVQLEKQFENEYNGQLYMYFLMFSNMETLEREYKEIYKDEIASVDKNLIDYAKYLENQLVSSSQTKRKILKDINAFLEEEELETIHEGSELEARTVFDTSYISNRSTIRSISPSPMPKLKKNMPKSSHKKDVHKEDVNSLTPDFITPMKKKNREGLKVMKAPILQNTEQTEESKSPDDFFMSSTAKLLGSDHTAKKNCNKKARTSELPGISGSHPNKSF